MKPTEEEKDDSKRQPATTKFRCLYCCGTQGRCSAIPNSSTRSITECCSCSRVVEERHSQTHPFFSIRAQDIPLPLVTPDLNTEAILPSLSSDKDPFHPTGFITTFSAWSLDPAPVFAKTSYSFAGHLAELERALGTGAAEGIVDGDVGPNVSVDRLRAYVQILDVSSILLLDQDIADHAFRLFKDCSLTTCLRNRSVEALATASLVQAIREAQEPRTLQEISSAANLPQKEIGKYIKILGEALKLCQPINSNSISVHMPRFCMLLQLNKSAQELAAHIGEVVINKCFCTRRNPISISAAAIYLACQLEDKRKTQAEICKVTGLTEVTLRKVYKELLENWDDLLPPNYTPAVPPEKAFPMTTIPSSRSSMSKTVVAVENSVKVQQEKEKQKQHQQQESANQHTLWQTQVRSGGHHVMQFDAKKDTGDQRCSMIKEPEVRINNSNRNNNSFQITNQLSTQSGVSNGWPFQARPLGSSSNASTSSNHIGHHDQRNSSSLNQEAYVPFGSRTKNFNSRTD